MRPTHYPDVYRTLEACLLAALDGGGGRETCQRDGLQRRTVLLAAGESMVSIRRSLQRSFLRDGEARGGGGGHKRKWVPGVQGGGARWSCWPRTSICAGRQVSKADKEAAGTSIEAPAAVCGVRTPSLTSGGGGRIQVEMGAIAFNSTRVTCRVHLSLEICSDLLLESLR